MLSVDEYNAQKIAKRKADEAARKRTGVACPQCGDELLWPEGVIGVIACYPPKTTRAAHCLDCKLTIELEM